MELLPDRVLVVADWRADPHASTTIVARRAAARPAVFGLVVPAWLHGLDWIGDPYATRPCAQRQAEALARMWTLAGLSVESATVGDPDPLAAVDDALDGWRATEVMLIARSANPVAIHPFALARRIERTTGLPTTRVAIGPDARAARPRLLHLRSAFRLGRCDPSLLR